MKMKIEEVRKAYADAVCDAAKVTSPALRHAFAVTPRERFLGPGPWFVRGPQPGAAGMTEDAEPERVYQNVSIAIDRDRELFNGQPALVATWLDSLDIKPGERVLHIGCGTGYYSAVLASVVGPGGHVFAIEADPALASQAHVALNECANVTVAHGDGRTALPSGADVVLVHAGATHVLREWLQATRDGARLLVPLTVSMPAMSPTLSKGVLLKARRHVESWSATVDSMLVIYSLTGLRDDTSNGALGRALMGGSMSNVKGLRCDAHPADASCWLHRDGVCISMAAD
jgi:protein-L-isoaspartate(D-aspartate) O-methyltransferase